MSSNTLDHERELVEILINKEWKKTGTVWSEEAVRLGIRAKFRCEYCGRNLLASIEDYDVWQRDHIIPKSKGGSEKFVNIALACKPCNFYKRNYLVESRDGEPANRAEAIDKLRGHIGKKRKDKKQELKQLQNSIRRLLPQIPI